MENKKRIMIDKEADVESIKNQIKKDNFLKQAKQIRDFSYGMNRKQRRRFEKITKTKLPKISKKQNEAFLKKMDGTK